MQWQLFSTVHGCLYILAETAIAKAWSRWATALALHVLQTAHLSHIIFRPYTVFLCHKVMYRAACCPYCGKKSCSFAVMNGYRERRAVIEQLGKELLEVNEQGLEQVEGHRVVELLATTPIASLDDSSSPDSNGSTPHSAPSVRLYSVLLRPVFWHALFLA